MTSFDVYESSVEESRPIEVYEFVMGTTTYRYTSYAQDVTVGVNTYTATAMSRGRIEQGSDQQNRNMVITLPSTDALAAQYIGVVPGEKVTLSIFRLQPDEAPAFDTQALIFKGQVQSVRFPANGHVAEIVVRSVESARNQIIPRYTYAGMCSHMLYSTECGVVQSSFTFTGPVASGGDTAVVTVTGASGQPDGYWTGGYATATTGNQDFRAILDHTGDVITLLLPFAADISGLNLQLYAGCDHILTGDCKTKFENCINFGGHAFVPSRNPYDGL